MKCCMFFMLCSIWIVTRNRVPTLRSSIPAQSLKRFNLLPRVCFRFWYFGPMRMFASFIGSTFKVLILYCASSLFHISVFRSLGCWPAKWDLFWCRASLAYQNIWHHIFCAFLIMYCVSSSVYHFDPMSSGFDFAFRCFAQCTVFLHMWGDVM